MDLNSLKEQVSNLSLYDLKAGVRKVQNAVMNYTEMEAKVREATNNEPWGASSTIMSEIANGTFNYSLLSEIMPMIYKRFTDKSAEEWRQIYKALQLLEFLVKNGSERVIDDARSHLTLLKMLRQFHYIDQNGKDQGVNVRNRAKELTDLLGDVDRIRAERKKARATRNKYGGVEGGAGFGSSMSGGSGSRYGGFGSQDLSYGGYSGGVYGDGGGFGGNTSGFQDTASRRDRFEEYDEYDEGAVASPTRRGESSKHAAVVSREQPTKSRPEPPARKEPEVDLLSVGDDDTLSKPAAATSSNGKRPDSSGLDAGFTTFQSATPADDDFDDFQSAAPVATVIQTLPLPGFPSTASSIQPAVPKASQPPALNSFAGLSSIPPAQSASTATVPSTSSLLSSTPSIQPAHKPAATAPSYQSAQPNYFTSVPLMTTPSHPLQSFTSTLQGSQVPKPTGSTSSSASAAVPGAKTGSDAFGSLWSSASAGIKKTSATAQQGPNLASMAKQKATAGIWGAAAAGGQAPQQQQEGTRMQGQVSAGQVSGQKGSGAGGGLDDLLI